MGVDQRKFSVNYDFLRAAAVLCVYVSHLRALIYDSSTWASLGRFGVVMFFVHTSAVLMASLRRLESEHSSDRALVVAFWVKRIFRIYPLAIFTVLVTLAFHVPADPRVVYFWMGTKTLIANLLLVMNIVPTHEIQGVMWSLPLEVQMYAVLPFAYFVVRGNRRYWSLPLWLLSVVLPIFLLKINWRFGFMDFAPCFIAGVVAFDLSRVYPEKWKLPSWVWPLAILTSIVLYHPHDDLSFQQHKPGLYLLPLFLGLMYSACGEGSSGWLHRTFHWIAEHSYGIYLWHMPIFWFVYYPMRHFPMPVKIATLAIGSIAIPAILYVSLEKPLVLAGNHVSRRMLRKSHAQMLERVA